MCLQKKEVVGSSLAQCTQRTGRWFEERKLVWSLTYILRLAKLACSPSTIQQWSYLLASDVISSFLLLFFPLQFCQSCFGKHFPFKEFLVKRNCNDQGQKEIKQGTVPSLLLHYYVQLLLAQLSSLAQYHFKVLLLISPTY